MSRPRSESEYLASLIPPSVAAAGLSRRGFLKGTLSAGAAVSLSCRRSWWLRPPAGAGTTRAVVVGARPRM